jgi:hypothetical protein
MVVSLPSIMSPQPPPEKSFDFDDDDSVLATEDSGGFLDADDEAVVPDFEVAGPYYAYGLRKGDSCASKSSSSRKGGDNDVICHAVLRRMAQNVGIRRVGTGTFNIN